jgi:hypothetical protein
MMAIAMSGGGKSEALPEYKLCAEEQTITNKSVFKVKPAQLNRKRNDYQKERERERKR